MTVFLISDLAFAVRGAFVPQAIWNWEAPSRPEETTSTLYTFFLKYCANRRAEEQGNTARSWDKETKRNFGGNEREKNVNFLLVSLARLAARWKQACGLYIFLLFLVYLFTYT